MNRTLVFLLAVAVVGCSGDTRTEVEKAKDKARELGLEPTPVMIDVLMEQERAKRSNEGDGDAWNAHVEYTRKRLKRCDIPRVVSNLDPDGKPVYSQIVGYWDEARRQPVSLDAGTEVSILPGDEHFNEESGRILILVKGQNGIFLLFQPRVDPYLRADPNTYRWAEKFYGEDPRHRE